MLIFIIIGLLSIAGTILTFYKMIKREKEMAKARGYHIISRLDEIDFATYLFLYILIGTIISAVIVSLISDSQFIKTAEKTTITAEEYNIISDITVIPTTDAESKVYSIIENDITISSDLENTYFNNVATNTNIPTLKILSQKYKNPLYNWITFAPDNQYIYTIPEGTEIITY